jgi:hypothetical protein
MVGTLVEYVNVEPRVYATRAKRYTPPLPGALGTMAKAGERRREELQMLARAKGLRG